MVMVGHSLPGKPVSKATGAALVRDGAATAFVTPWFQKIFMKMAFAALPGVEDKG